MIQRIQTIYLVLALALCGLIFFVPLSILLPEMEGGLSYKLGVFGIENTSDKIIMLIEFTPVLLAFLGIVTLIILAAIFLFKNRKLQMKLCILTGILLLIFFALIFYFTNIMSGFGEVESNISYLAGTYLPIIAVILLLLANKAIKRDEDLVRSADRLR